MEESKIYIEGVISCWKCHKETKVYSWKGHKAWPEKEPPQPKPVTILWKYSATLEGYYWANTCQFCGAIQGDWYLYDEPDGPFWNLELD